MEVYKIRMKKFALLGVAGYIAPRHLKAIKETENQLTAALDPSDSVGILDQYFPKADFFIEFKRFERYLEKLKRNQDPLDYVSICTPNYLHDSHIRMALIKGADAICEKPLVLNPCDLDSLQDIEYVTGKKVHTILQLRLHPSIITLKKKIENNKTNTKKDVDLTYITSRGKWYHVSWKGEPHKSGGITTNIGIHFYDMLAWIFGELREIQVHLRQVNRAAGYIEFEKARVRWFLSTDEKDLPLNIKIKKQRTYRSITIDQTEIEFSHNFTELHTKSYKKILMGQGFGLREAKKSVEIAHLIRNFQVKCNNNFKHKFISK